MATKSIATATRLYPLGTIMQGSCQEIGELIGGTVEHAVLRLRSDNSIMVFAWGDVDPLAGILDPEDERVESDPHLYSDLQMLVHACAGLDWGRYSDGGEYDQDTRQSHEKLQAKLADLCAELWPMHDPTAALQSA